MDVEYIPAKTIVSGYAADNSWFGCNYNMNIYKGCCHGCIYCDSRSDCYQIENFDRVKVKENAIDLIHSQLMKKRKKGVVGTGSMSDPYNPLEKELKLTRQALELIDTYRFGCAIATKSGLITRDIDILKRINKHSPVICKITVTTSDENLCKIIEPNVNPSSKRFAAVKTLSGEGIYSGVLLMPVLPYIEDTEQNIKNIVRLSYENGAKFIFAAFGMTLRSNQRWYYYSKLDEHFPNLKKKYISVYGDKYSCKSENARTLWKLFTMECKKYGLLYKMKDIVNAYKNEYEDKNEQLSLFD